MNRRTPIGKKLIGSVQGKRERGELSAAKLQQTQERLRGEPGAVGSMAGAQILKEWHILFTAGDVDEETTPKIILEEARRLSERVLEEVRDTIALIAKEDPDR